MTLVQQLNISSFDDAIIYASVSQKHLVFITSQQTVFFYQVMNSKPIKLTSMSLLNKNLDGKFLFLPTLYWFICVPPHSAALEVYDISSKSQPKIEFDFRPHPDQIFSLSPISMTLFLSRTATIIDIQSYLQFPMMV
jgi:hypothetical protein